MGRTRMRGVWGDVVDKNKVYAKSVENVIPAIQDISIRHQASAVLFLALNLSTLEIEITSYIQVIRWGLTTT